MPANLTPVNDSNSWIVQALNDAVWSRVSGMGATSSTSSVSIGSVTAQFGLPLLAKTVYAAPAPNTTTINYSTQSGLTATITTQYASAPIKLVSMTQYGNLIPTVNATVWNSADSAQSLFLLANDIVSFKVALVADSVV